LGVVWDIDVSTTHFRTSFYVGNKETAPTGIFFSPDGYSFYLIGINSKKLFKYKIPQILSSHIYINYTKSFNPSSVYLAVFDSQNDMTTDEIGDVTYQLKVDAGTTIKQSAVESNIYGLTLKNETLYVCPFGDTNNLVKEYSLDLEYLGTSHDLSAQINNYLINVFTDGTYFYAIDTTSSGGNTYVHKYDSSWNYVLSSPSLDSAYCSGGCYYNNNFYLVYSGGVLKKYDTSWNEIASYSIDSNSKDIWIENDIAYVITSTTPSQIIKYDISDFTEIDRISLEFNTGTGLAISGNVIYCASADPDMLVSVVKESNITNELTPFEIHNISLPNKPTKVIIHQKDTAVSKIAKYVLLLGE